MSVSLCMIVKNEEESLARCLESVKDLVDEMIIVDTGSKDTTIDIAKSFGAQIFHYKWNDSFADARNFSLSKANCDWMLIMDADDELVKEDFVKLKDLINDQNTAGAYYMKTLCFTGEVPDLASTILNMNIRLLHNGFGYQFVGNIHEHPVGGLPDHPTLTADVSFYHYGYLQQSIDTKNKRKRNRELIEREVEAHPEDLTMRFYLGNEYYAEQNFKMAIDIYKKCLSLCNPASTLVTKMLFRMILCCQALGDIEGALSYAEKALVLFPNFTDAEFLRASLFLRQNKISKAICSLNRCIKMGDPPPILGDVFGAGTFRPQQALSEIYFNMRLYSKAYYHCHKALTLGALTRSAFGLMQQILIARGYSPDSTLHRLMKYAKLGGDAGFLMVSDIYYDQKQYGEAIKLLEKAQKIDPDGQNSEQITYYKGKCYFYIKEFTEAKRYFSTIKSDALTSKSEYFSILCNYMEMQEMGESKKGNIKDEYYNVLIKFKELLAGEKCTSFCQGKDAWQNYLEPIFSLLDILLKMERFDDFGRAVELLKMVDNDNGFLLLAKTYYNNKCYQSAYAEFIRSINQTGNIDAQGLDMMKNILLFPDANNANVTVL